MLVYRWPYGWAMVVNASNREKIVAWLNEHKGGRNVQIMDQTAADLHDRRAGAEGARAVPGPVRLRTPRKLAYYLRHADAATRASRASSAAPATPARTASRSWSPPRWASPLWEELIKRGAKPCGLGAPRHAAAGSRHAALRPRTERGDRSVPGRPGLGGEARQGRLHRPRRPATAGKTDAARRVRVGLELDGKRIAREGCGVLRRRQDRSARVTSGTFAPTLQKAIAMAYVDPAVAAVGTKVEMDIRGKTEPAAVVPLPFYKRAK